MKRIIVWGINYAPELTGIAPYNKMLCEHLAAAGFEVGMVTSFPYYPAWKKAPGDAGRLYRTDSPDGLPVHRCWHYVPSGVTTLKRMLHEASFIATSFLRLLALPRPDLYIVVSPPLLSGFTAWVLSVVKGAPFIFHVQDLQPDAAVGLGMVKGGAFVRLLYALEAVAYRRAARVSGISHGMIAAFRSKAVPPAKLIYFPNPVALETEPAVELTPGGFRRQHGFEAGDFLVVYSGNLGFKQGTEIAVEAARLLTDTRVRIVICGEGARRGHLEMLIRDAALDNVTLLPLLERTAYHQMLNDADVCLITQQKGSGRAFFPSKLLATLALSKPVVTVADEESELCRACAEGGFGINVPPERPQELAGVLRELADAPERLAAFSHAGRRFVAQFEKGKVLGDFTAAVRTVLAESPRAAALATAPAD